LRHPVKQPNFSQYYYQKVLTRYTIIIALPHKKGTQFVCLIIIVWLI